MKIQKYINNKNKYRVDKNYQRYKDAWSMEDKQCLIDTILKGEPMPLFFLNHKSDEDLYYIVDGQQRLSCIYDFYQNKIKLNKKFSGDELSGKTFSEESTFFDDTNKENFLDYDLNFYILEDYNDEKVRSIFSRLQRGKPLSLGEKLNAKPGNIVILMRKLANHNFITESTRIVSKGYGTFPDAARFLFYEKYGAKQCGTKEIFSFFDNHRDLGENSKEFKNIMKVLNFLERCFPINPGNYSFLDNHAWVFTIYTMIRDLMLTYSLTDMEENIRKFIQNFHGKVYSEDMRHSNRNYARFYENIRGGWSEKIITLRKTVIINEFIKRHPLKEFSHIRQISQEDKISIYNEKCGQCENCKVDFKDYKEPEYHHKVRYADGGDTTKDNIQVLCQNCHKEVHGKGKINPPTYEDETEEFE